METHRTTPKDFFLYLFGAVTLYLSATTLITLLWQLVNVWLPETVSYGSDPAQLIRWSVSLLVVAFPAYLVAMWRVGKDVDKEPGKRDLWVRRWFVWATIFVAAVVVLGDLVTILYAFLGGEMALRFLLKALAVGVVALAVFAYHWYLLKREPGTGIGTRKLITAISAVLVGAAIVTGISVAGSPQSARALRDDRIRVSDLQNVQYQVATFWTQKGRLPQDMKELVDPANPMPIPRDPKTGEAYRLEARGTYEFALCATFETEFTEEDAVRQMSYAPDEFFFAESNKNPTWSHGTGETCFSRTIDPDRYPKND